MPVDAELLALVARVGNFHITQRAMKRAHAEIEAAIARDDVGNDARRAYLDEVRRYFTSFDSEARAHLRDVDRRLEQINQIQFNLTAERGVAVKRIEATSGVLESLAALAERLS
jgi:hypothetical protein